MSSDTTKENASVVDSSVTEWKQDIANSDDPESSSYRGNEDSNPSRVEGENCPDQLESSNKNGKLPGKTRYFVIKSLNYQNIQLSVKRGIWATQVMNEPILEEAFHNSSRVILIFSVNMSGFFQGYAEMMSPVGWRRDNIWSQGNNKNNPWGRSFKVKWLRLNELPFHRTLHLKNPLNDYKPVKISRDCQELPEDIGEALCELLDGNSFEDGSSNRDGHSMKWAHLDSPFSSGDDEYNMSNFHTTWARTNIPYYPFVYRNQNEASRSHLAPQGGYSQSNLQVDQNISSQFNMWGLPAESPLASTLTEDDFLEMSYEEYLEAHNRSMKQLGLPMVAPCRTTYDWSSQRHEDDDSDSNSVKGRCLSRKRSRHSP